METYSLQDRIRGSLIGGAVGDALGYAVEFVYSYADIVKKYGDCGITRYDTSRGMGVAQISDDTQMTLFTACGLLNACKTGKEYAPSICAAYIEWMFPQIGKWKKKKYENSWIGKLPEVQARRAPGRTCISALLDIAKGKEPCNNSKGCGGVMRIAPIPLFAAAGHIHTVEDCCKLAADASELTHQHPLGYIPSALVAYLIYKLALDKEPAREKYKEYISEGLALIVKMYPGLPNYVEDFSRLIKKAVLWSDISADDVQTIENELGEGWVADETVAIAIYCSLKYFDDFEKAIIASVNHKGDSDSTGAVTGNMLGAALGYVAIPEFYKEDLELHDVILHVADDLCQGTGTEFNQ